MWVKMSRKEAEEAWWSAFYKRLSPADPLIDGIVIGVAGIIVMTFAGSRPGSMRVPLSALLYLFPIAFVLSYLSQLTGHAIRFLPSGVLARQWASPLTTRICSDCKIPARPYQHRDYCICGGEYLDTREWKWVDDVGTL